MTSLSGKCLLFFWVIQLLWAAPQGLAAQNAKPVPPATASPAQEEAIRLDAAAARERAGAVSLDMAREAAHSAARVTVMDGAARRIVELEELRFAMGADRSGGFFSADPLALAYALMKLQDADPESRVSVSGGTVTVRLEYGSGPREELPARVAELFESPIILEPYAIAAEMEKERLADYDAAAGQLLPLINKTSSAPDDVFRQRLDAAFVASARLKAVRILIDILPGLTHLDKASPEDLAAYKQMLEEAMEQDKDNYLVLCSLAQVSVKLGLLSSAYKLAERTLEIRSDYADAWNIKGAVMLAMQKPSLALADYDRALELASDVPEYHYSRAVVHMVLGNSKEMCLDLKESCNLGLCAGYEWAVSGGKCD